MAGTPIVTRIETTEFEWVHPRGELHLKHLPHACAIRISTDQGATGEYVGGQPVDHDSIRYIAHLLIGYSALDRSGFYERAKHATRQIGRVGPSTVDIALWDLAGKWYEAPVYELLGAGPKRLRAYASTSPGDPAGGPLGSPEGYADFADQCYDLGYRAFKVHAWIDGDVEHEIAAAKAVGERVGDRMVLMDDPSSGSRTFADAVRLGLTLDDYRYFWYEDPYADTGISSSGHRRLRERVRTPLLLTEHLRWLEPKVDFAVNGGTDLLRADPENDGGITGVMKIAHAAEGLGTDVELHFAGPAHRHAMTAIRNTNYYEMALVHPDYDLTSPATSVALDYRDGLDAIDADGCVAAPTGPGLGVTYDWELIERRRIGGSVWEIE
ncbi:MAG: hypothetical protein KF727_03465 [Microbacteriaceae bacterium]|nr:hypothetical protein [Microbacteriaceae bacterium]